MTAGALGCSGPVAALLVLGAGWGITQPLAKIAVSGGYREFGLVFWQLALGALVLLAVLRLRGTRLRVTPARLGVWLLIALIGTILPNTASYRAVAHLPSGVMSIVVATVPMFAFPVALLLGIDRFSLRRLAGLTLGLAGVALIALPGTSLPDPAMALWLPLALIAPLCYAFEGNLVARFGTAGMGPIATLAGASLLGAAIMAPVALATGQFILPAAPYGPPDAAILGIAGVHSLVYAGYVWLVGRAGSVFAAQVAYLVTGAGVLWAMVLLGERYSLWIWAALALMLAGLTLVQPRMPALAPQGQAGQAGAPRHGRGA